MSDQRYQIEIAAFGVKLRELRLERGMTQLDLELATGISRTEISRIETAQRNLEFYTMVRLAEALGIELRTLFEPLRNLDLQEPEGKSD